MNSSLLKRIEQLERVLQPLPDMQILRVVMQEPGERVIGIEAAPELGLPALDRYSDESEAEFERRWQACVKWPASNRGIVVLRSAP